MHETSTNISSGTPTSSGGGGPQLGGDGLINSNAPEIRSPSPKKNGNILGLGLAPSMPTSATSSVLITYPHLGHYIFSLIQNIQSSPPRLTSNSSGQHPLSLSSSGESDESEDDADDGDNEQKTPRKQRVGKRAGQAGLGKEEVVVRIVELLDNDDEEEVKEVLKPFMGELAKDDILMDQVCLDCMHRRRDDRDSVPYAPHLTPGRARGSPAMTSQPLRPYTPTRVPSFRSRTPLARPQSPSHLPSTGAMTPTLPHGPSNLGISSASPSLGQGGPSTGSPSASPRLLNAKATDFKPSPRVPSAPLTAGFLPSDPWKDAPPEPPRSASPYGAIRPPGMARTNSNLAIASPLFSDPHSPFHSPMGTPNRTTIKMPDVFSSPGLSAPRTSSRGLIPDDDDEDEFSPFGRGLPPLQPLGSSRLSSGAKPFEPFISSNDVHFGSSSTLSSSMPKSDSSFSGSGDSTEQQAIAEDEPGAGMTPLDVLSSVFATVPRFELEDALTRSNYDFEGAMAILVSAHTLPRSGSSTPQRVASPRPLLGIGNRAAMPLNQPGPRDGYFQQGGRTVSGNLSPGFGGIQRSPGGHGTRMCRYYLNGECRRSDCRFSHDLDRALCRFWLRGHCAKGPNCEFMHHFPNNLDPNALSNAMARVQLSNDGSASPSADYGGPPEEFPDLLAARLGRNPRFDPSRNRFANAVKRVHPTAMNPTLQVTGARYTSNSTQGPLSPGLDARAPINPVPKPSQRVKLRPPTLLPTLRTGAGANEQYMSTRATAIRLGHARNACLARAADAFRRGDGAAAKRFSREGKSLNERMLNEAADAAQALVRERRQEAQNAIKIRDSNWSEDPRDRSERGTECGAGLGVVMGVASARGIAGGEHLLAEERTECLLDLHTLHGTEGSDVLGQFLAELDRETYRGLAYILVGEEKHVGSQDPARGASKTRLAASIKQSLAEWGYPWNENSGIICVDPCRYCEAMGEQTERGSRGMIHQVEYERGRTG